MGDKNSWSRARGFIKHQAVDKDSWSKCLIDQRLSQEEFDLLSSRYGLKYRSISEFESLSLSERKWVLSMMDIAYKRGRFRRSGGQG
ncbi:hypothetical protein JR311_20270 (plasmid) [Bacillus velezensis]|uniref:hypothetical protein n=1 Tax=Bacillus velezensis TaxID=492670 RepID=UPI00195E3866|nr:hypothetical protein [Bacillus velezensis]QRV11363.1 hypothetical protein JR311_20270 [Bacillus velezensis]